MLSLFCFLSLSLLSSSNSCIVPHPLWGHTISSLGSSRGNTFCVRRALEGGHNLLWSLSSSFLLYTAPCREIFSCVSSLFFPSFSQHVGLNCCQGWILDGGHSLRPLSLSVSLSCQCVFALMMRRAVLLSQVFYTAMKCYTSCKTVKSLLSLVGFMYVFLVFLKNCMICVKIGFSVLY